MPHSVLMISFSAVCRYVSIVMTGVETVLSLCEVEVFSSTSVMAVSSCSQRLPPDEVSSRERSSSSQTATDPIGSFNT